MKAVIVGCGAIADRWTRVLAADRRVDVVALVDTDPDRTEALARRRCPTARRATSLGQAHDHVDADLVINLTPPHLHTTIAREALTAGLHVLTEKPLTLQLRDAVELADLAQTNRRVLAVMHNRARDPRFVAFADQVTAAGRGPLAVTAEVVVELREAGFRRDLALPVTTDLAVHAFDQIQALVPADPVRVSAAEVTLPVFGGHGGLTTIAVTFADGSVFSYRGGFSGPGLATTAVGVWRVDGPGLAVRWPAGDEPSDGQPSAYQRCITNMLDTVQAVDAGAASPRPALGLRSVAMLEAALAAATTGDPTPVAPVAPVPREHP